jgi:SAM-dependent methyltransferase
MGQLNLNDWHLRFIQQAGWTKDIREYLFGIVNFKAGNKILDVGCGTGVINEELGGTGLSQYGLDINLHHLMLATHHSADTHYLQGDANQLPYADHSFNLVYCHFLLMWVKNPRNVLEEMKRVTKPGGKVMALAEPDYGGRIDHPPELAALGEFQIKSLQRQGANPLIGRQLLDLFNSTGLESVEAGLLGGQWSGQPSWDSWRQEWQVFRSDMEKAPGMLATTEIKKLEEIEREAVQNGRRVLFVPTFYACGTVRI